MYYQYFAEVFVKKRKIMLKVLLMASLKSFIFLKYMKNSQKISKSLVQYIPYIFPKHLVCYYPKHFSFFNHYFNAKYLFLISPSPLLPFIRDCVEILWKM
jgi:hypothetical protein